MTNLWDNFRYVGTIEICNLLFFLVFVFGSGDFREVFEFFMFAGRDTHRIRKEYSELPFHKRHFMSTLFDDEWGKTAKYQEQLRALFWARYMSQAIALILFIPRCFYVHRYLESRLSIPIWFDIICLIYALARCVFATWFSAHTIDDYWRRWFHKHATRHPFSMRLPDEDKKKKRRRDR